MSNVDATQPTLRLARQLQTAFDFFNEALFDGDLQPTLLVLNDHKNAKGYFLPKRYVTNKKADALHKIALNPVVMYERDIKETLSTLVHEMVHLKIEQSGKGPVKPYHCKKWSAAMVEIGLTPIVVNAKGFPTGKPTGRNATHEIVAGGPFCVACDELIAQGFDIDFAMLPDIKPERKKKAKKKKTKFTYTCGGCDSTVEGKAGLNIDCHDCEQTMTMEQPEPEENEDE